MKFLFAIKHDTDGYWNFEEHTWHWETKLRPCCFTESYARARELASLKRAAVECYHVFPIATIRKGTPLSFDIEWNDNA